ncbi:MAG: hypothetical protein SCALA702_30150 [Melioribacteraceae bacterium]|nr:MAG: hypothetical protein SCALA702_30150 [Melioribacteraceae bacterium]
MAKIVSTHLLPDKILYVEYNDGITGELDLKKLANKPQYSKLNDQEYLESFTVDSKSGDIVWEGMEPLCKNALYRQFELKNMMKRLKISDELL